MHSRGCHGRTILYGLMAITVLCLYPSFGFANSATDSSGVTWSVTRVYNLGSGGWDINVTTDESPPASYGITTDSLGDDDPYLLINPVSDKAWVIWSRQAMGGYRIYYSYFDGSDFSDPAPVTSGGTGYADSQPHFAFESNGDIHLVFYRDYSTGTDKAFYCSYVTSWSALEQYSLASDDVTGSTFITITYEDPDYLEAVYHYGDSQERTRCRVSSGDPSPWESCD